MEIFQKSSIVGLDIGASSIKLAQFMRKDDGLRLVRADLKEIGKDSGEKEILSSLKELLRGINVRRSKFIVNINCPKTCVSLVTAPYMPKAELKDGIRLTAKNYFPFAIDNALLDYEILGDIVEKGLKKHKLVVATSPKETVGRYISLLNKAGIKPSSFIPVSLALQKIIENSCPKKDEIKAVLDIGERFTELAIFGSKNLVFSRKIPVSGSDFTKALTGAVVSDRGKTELSLDEAERIKIEVGIPLEDEFKIIDGKISTTQIMSMIRPTIEQLISEINRCFDYYREETRGTRIDSLVLFGGGASLIGLPEFLSGELGIDVKLGNPLENIKIESGTMLKKDDIPTRLAQAVGAALSFGKGMNLLPQEIKEEAKRILKRATILTVSTATVLILAFIYIGMKLQLVNLQKRTDVALLEFASLQPQLRLAETQSLANAALAKEPYWEDLFKELSNVTPEDIYLTELKMENKVIEIKGIATTEEAEELISDLILTLERGIFKNVKLVTIKDIKETANEFVLKCWVD